MIVKNVTVQNNVIRHVAAVFNILGYDDISTSQQTQDITIRNNLIYDVSSAYATPNNPAPARLAIIGAGPRNITFDHNTVDNTGSSTIFFYKGKSPTGRADHRLRADQQPAAVQQLRDFRRPMSVRARWR